MKSFRLRFSLISALLALTSSLMAEDKPGPLDAYVAAPDDSYGWSLRREGETNGVKYAELTFTSQTWHDIVWRHQLFVLRPSEIRDSSRALLLIGGGRWDDSLAEPATDQNASVPREAAVLARLAEAIGAPVAVLLHVPQQPIFGDMVEDEIISYTFSQYLTTKDATWPLLLPMVKSAVRGMDAVTEYLATTGSKVSKFTLTGASKRGWTTWLTSAVDPRVDCLAPMVIDVLNMEKQMKHQLATWGKFSEEIEDYTRRGLQSQSASEAGKALNQIVDPFNYRDRVQQPKLIILGTNDRYWPVDALNLYWDDLPGEKRVMYTPNQGHGIQDVERLVGSIAALHRQASGELKLPNLAWDYAAGDGALTLSITSDQPPEKVTRWLATSATRDFRDAKWQSEDLDAKSRGWTANLEYPAEGYAAMFGEAVYVDGGHRYFLSTNLRIAGPDGEIKPAK